jgi:hypothetical protein
MRRGRAPERSSSFFRHGNRPGEYTLGEPVRKKRSEGAQIRRRLPRYGVISPTLTPVFASRDSPEITPPPNSNHFPAGTLLPSILGSRGSFCRIVRCGSARIVGHEGNCGRTLICRGRPWRAALLREKPLRIRVATSTDRVAAVQGCGPRREQRRRRCGCVRSGAARNGTWKTSSPAADEVSIFCSRETSAMPRPFSVSTTSRSSRRDRPSRSSASA